MDTISLLSWGLALQGTRALEGSLLPAVRVTPGFVELVFLMEAGPVGGTEGSGGPAPWGRFSLGSTCWESPAACVMSPLSVEARSLLRSVVDPHLFK